MPRPLQLGDSQMGGCQSYGPLLGTLNIRGRIMIGTQKGTIILTTTQMPEGRSQRVSPPRPDLAREDGRARR